MAGRFHIDEPLGPGDVVLTGAEAHHLAAVSRLAPGDDVVLFNGDGRDYLGRVVEIARKRVTIHVHTVDPVNRESAVRCHLVAAMPKGDRGDVMIEKLTELGVARFTPLNTQRTIVLPKPDRLDNLRRTVIEASKQCRRNRLMTIDPLTTWPAFLHPSGLPEHRLILHPGGRDLRRLNSLPQIRDVVIAIGPEGGFTDEELAIATGWTTVSLGPRILRIETAAIAAAALFANQ